MVSFINLLLPNLAETGLGLIYIVVAVILFFIGLYIKVQGIPFLDRIINIVALGFLLFGLFTIFAVSFIEDILSDPVLSSLVIGALLIGVNYYLLFTNKNKRKRK